VIGIIHYLWQWNTFILAGELRVPWVGNTSISIYSGKNPKLILQEKMMTPWPSSGMVIILGGHGNCSLLPTTELRNPWSWESLLQSGGGSGFWFQVGAMSLPFQESRKINRWGVEFIDQSWTKFWSIPELEFLCQVIAYLQGFLSFKDAVKEIPVIKRTRMQSQINKYINWGLL